MTSPPITLLLLLLGIGAGVLLVGSLVQPRAWALAAALVAVLLLAVYLPVRLRDSGRVLDAQRVSNRGGTEQAARERCLLDMGREDLVQKLALARERIPEDARFRLKTDSPSLACFTLNLLPRQPARTRDFDPTRDWRILDGAGPGGFRLVPPSGGSEQ